MHLRESHAQTSLDESSRKNPRVHTCAHEWRKVKRRRNDPTVLITPTWTGDAPLRLDTKTIHGIFSNYFRALN